MRFYRVLATLILVGTMGVSLVGDLAAADHPSVAAVKDYFDLLQSGNIESASYLWTEANQERATRFDIEYEGIIIKADCTSPVVLNLSEKWIYADPSVRRYVTLSDGFVKVEYMIPAMSRDTTYIYYAVQDGDYYWLTYPQDYYARDWPVRHTKYLRIHYHADREDYLNQVAFDEVDAFVERIADSLEISSDLLDLIAENKIEYYYCDSDATVQDITQHKTKGLLDLASNDIITANFPHYHELTHLLINIKLKQLPLYTIPLIREGMAVRLGGRWGKTAGALMDLGIYLYQEQLMDLDSILSYSDFATSASADISYPVAGLFAAWLEDRLGQGKFFKFYIAASGGFKELNAMDAVDVKNLIMSHTGHEDWLDLRADFSEFLNKRTEKHRAAIPGNTGKGKEVLSEGNYRVISDKNWFTFEFSGSGNEPPAGNFLFGHDTGLDEKYSLLFQEQYLGQFPFEGYRFGVRFDQHEAGLYDYATNQLLAKYIWGITPSADYFDEEANKISIRFSRELVEKQLSDEVRCKMLPH